MKLLVATGNPHKLSEFRELLAPLGIDVLAPDDAGGLPPVEEDLDTFAGNAAKKAASAARAAGMWALADDSGLEVDALNGAPGVRSARFAGPRADDAANNARLLAELRGVPAARRGARFVAALAVADPDGVVRLAVEGEARGRIRSAPAGSTGFGYDPLFEFTEQGFQETGRTFAEIAPAQKRAVSHRGRALAALVAPLAELAGESGE